MNRIAKKRQHHEQARKKIKHDRIQHARDAAKKPRSSFPRWLLAGALTLVLGFVLLVAFGR